MAQEPENGGIKGGEGSRPNIAQSIIGSGNINSFREGIVDAVEAALEKRKIGGIFSLRKPPAIPEDFFSDKASINEKRKTLGSYIQDHFFTEEYMRKNLHPSNAQVTNQQFYQWYDEVLEKLIERLTARGSNLTDTISEIRENLTQNPADYGVQSVEGEYTEVADQDAQAGDPLDGIPPFLRRGQPTAIGITASRTDAPEAKPEAGTDGDPDDDPDAVPEIIAKRLRTLVEQQGGAAPADCSNGCKDDGGDPFKLTDADIVSDDGRDKPAQRPTEPADDDKADAAGLGGKNAGGESPPQPKENASGADDDREKLFGYFNTMFGNIAEDKAVASQKTLNQLETHFSGYLNRGKNPRIVLTDTEDPDKKIHLQKKDDDAIARYVGDPEKFDAKSALAAAYSILEAEDRSGLDGNINIRLSGSEQQRALMQSALEYLHETKYPKLKYTVSEGYLDQEEKKELFDTVQKDIKSAYDKFYNTDDPYGDALKKAAEILKTVPNEGEFTPEFSGTSNERVLLSAALQHIAGITHPDLTILPGKGFIELSEQDFANAGVRILEAYKTFDRKMLPTPAPATKPTDQEKSDAKGDTDNDNVDPHKERIKAEIQKAFENHVASQAQQERPHDTLFKLDLCLRALAAATVQKSEETIKILHSVDPQHVIVKYRELAKNEKGGERTALSVGHYEGEVDPALTKLAAASFEDVAGRKPVSEEDLMLIRSHVEVLKEHGVTEDIAREIVTERKERKDGGGGIHPVGGESIAAGPNVV